MAHGCAGRVFRHSCFQQWLSTASVENTGEGGTPACFLSPDKEKEIGMNALKRMLAAIVVLAASFLPTIARADTYDDGTYTRSYFISDGKAIIKVGDASSYTWRRAVEHEPTGEMTIPSRSAAVRSSRRRAPCLSRSESKFLSELTVSGTRSRTTACSSPVGKVVSDRSSEST